MKKLLSVLVFIVLYCGFTNAQTPYDNFAPEQSEKEMLQLPDSHFQILNNDLKDSVKYASFDENNLTLSLYSSNNKLIRSLPIKPLESKFLTVDRFAEKYSSQSPYCYAANNPVRFIDMNGDSAWTINNQWNKDYIQGYQSFVQSQTQQYIKDGKEFTCEDLDLSLLVDYASQNGLPVTIVNGSGTFDARYDNYTDVATFKNDVLTTTGARDLQNTNNTTGITMNNAKSGDIILNVNNEGNAHHTQVLYSFNPKYGIASIVQGNSGAMNIIPGASSILGAGNPNSAFYTGQPIESAIYFTKTDYYKNLSTGNVINNYSTAKHINIRRWRFNAF